MATILGALWASSLKEQTQPTVVHQQFMMSLSNYIMGNVTFNGIFSGTNPMGTPLVTPIVAKVNTGKLGTEMPSFQDPKGGDGYAQWKTWISQVYAMITSDCGLLPAAFIPFVPMPCFRLVTPTTWDRPDLLNAVKGNENNPQIPLLDKLATGFMNDMKINYIPVFPGSIGPYVGAFTVSSIITP